MAVSLGKSVHRRQWPSVNDLFIALCSDVGGLPLPSRAGETRTKERTLQSDAPILARLRGGLKSMSYDSMSKKHKLSRTS